MGASVSRDLADRSERSQARRRAAVTLAAIALLAVIVGLLMATLTRTPSGNKQAVHPSVSTSAQPASVVRL
jgi:hypothetical protein